MPICTRVTARGVRSGNAIISISPCFAFQIAPMARTSGPEASGDWRMIGPAESTAASAPSFTASLISYWIDMTRAAGLSPLKTPATFSAGFDHSGIRSFQ